MKEKERMAKKEEEKWRGNKMKAQVNKKNRGYQGYERKK